MIGGIEGLKAKLELLLFAYYERLEKRCIPIHEPWPDQCVAADVTQGARRHAEKLVLIEESVGGAVGKRGVRSGRVGAIDDGIVSAIARIDSGGDVVGRSGLKSEDR